jgi:ubiquinone/menaquinone biosynthesis C-methylase UbiE
LYKKIIMNPNQSLWEKGDFTRIAETMRLSGEELVAKLDIAKGMQVLDLGCGDGTTAIPAARFGAAVTGIDIASNLVAAGNRRAQAAGLTNITFRQGDATDLQGIADHSFDLVMSIFGAMFASKPQEVANEMVRVAKPGGRVIMGNWIPGDPTLVAQLLKISSAYTPPAPEGFISPMLWGMEDKVIGRFTAAGLPPENISFKKESFTFNASYAPQAFVQLFKDYYGPTMNAFEAAAKNGKAAELQRELEELFSAQNSSPDKGATSIAATYLLVEARL